MLCFLFLSASCGTPSLHLYGKWGESLPYDEALLFFEYVRPDLTALAQQLLGEPSSISPNEILHVLRDSPYIPPNIIGLLNLTLNWRFFQPRASAARQDPERMAELRGYGVSVSGDLPTVEYNNFSIRMLSKLYCETTPETRLSFMRRFSQDYASVAKIVADTPALDEVARAFKELYNQSIAESIDVNGRITDGSPMDMLSALLDETQIKTVYKILNFTDKEDQQNISFTEPVQKVYTYMETPAHKRALVHHDHGAVLARSSKELNTKTQSPEEFIRYKDLLSSMQIFISLHSLQSLPTIRTILDMAKQETPFSFNVYCLGDLSNETEKKIVYSYVRTEETLGTREAIKFLLEGLKTGNWKLAYTKTRPTTKWDKIESQLYNISGTKAVVDQLDLYYKEHGITDFTYCVNGNFVNTTFAHLEVKRFYFSNILRLMDAAKAGKFVTNMSVDAFLINNSLILKSLKPPIEINDDSIISLAGIDARIITTILLKFTNHHFYPHKNQVSESSPIPVFYVDCEATNTKDPILQNSPSFDLYKIDSEEFSSEERLLSRIGDHPKTIVGPHVFKGALNPEQLEFALRYVSMRYMHNITTKATSRHVFYITLMRASQYLNGVHRQWVKDLLTPLYIAHFTNQYCEIKIGINQNPFSYSFRTTIEAATHIAESGAAVIWVLPLPPLDGINSPYPWMFDRFYPMMSPTDSAPGLPKSTFIGPSYWPVHRDGCNYVMDGLIVASYAPKASVISVGSQYRTALSNGYFQFILPPGVYPTKGIEEYLISDSLIPYLRFFRAKEEMITIPESNTLNIISVITDVSFERNFLIMLDSIKNSTTMPVKCFVARPPRCRVPEGIEIIPLPTWVPPFLSPGFDANVFNSMFKHGEIDFLIPTDVHRIIFVDQSVIMTNDLSRLLKVDMSTAAMAAPLWSTSKKLSKSLIFNERDSRLDRANRPYHTTRLFMFNMDNARAQHYFDYYRLLFTFRRAMPVFFTNYDDEIFNQLQLPCQLITLPEETSYSHKLTNPKKKNDAFSIFVYDQESEEELVGIKKYKTMKEFIYNKYSGETVQ